jgi:hypothetical protein
VEHGWLPPVPSPWNIHLESNMKAHTFTVAAMMDVAHNTLL